MIKRLKENTDRVAAKRISPMSLIAKEIVKFVKNISKPRKHKLARKPHKEKLIKETIVL